MMTYGSPSSPSSALRAYADAAAENLNEKNINIVILAEIRASIYTYVEGERGMMAEAVHMKQVVVRIKLPAVHNMEEAVAGLCKQVLHF